MDRKDWRLVVNVHVAEDDEQALREVKRGERHETVTYFEETLGRPPGRADDPLRDGVKMGTTLVGIAGDRHPTASSVCWNRARAASAACCSAPTNGPTASRH